MSWNNRRRFALRTVRNGAVRIKGVTFLAHGWHREYDGRLEGKRFAFGLYYEPDGEFYRESVHLWGTEAEYACQDEAEFSRLSEESPALVDGAYPWSAWYSDAGLAHQLEIHRKIGAETRRPSGSGNR